MSVSSRRISLPCIPQGSHAPHHRPRPSLKDVELQVANLTIQKGAAMPSLAGKPRISPVARARLQGRSLSSIRPTSEGHRRSRRVAPRAEESAATGSPVGKSRRHSASACSTSASLPLPVFGGGSCPPDDTKEDRYDQAFRKTSLPELQALWQDRPRQPSNSFASGSSEKLQDGLEDRLPHSLAEPGSSKTRRASTTTWCGRIQAGLRSLRCRSHSIVARKSHTMSSIEFAGITPDA